MLKGQEDSSRKDDGASDSSADSAADSPARPEASSPRKLRWFASILGLLGAVLAISVPLLPVNHEVNTLRWPTQEGGTKSVSAPLVSFSPVWMNAEVPCASIQSLDARSPGVANVLSTNPPNSDYGNLTGLTLQANNGQLVVLSKGQQIATVAAPAGPCAVKVHSDAGATKVSLGDQSLATLQGDQRPQLTGIYSDLDSKVDNTDGLSFSARVDNRYESSPTTLKLGVIVTALGCFVGSVICLRRMDGRAGRRAPRLVPRGWWKPTLRDAVVIGALAIWWIIGSMTSDDGYILTIARARESAGYISNYFRWFAVPEAPFGWFYELYSQWVKVSTATPWVRLPALLMGSVSWLLISREVLPRLGQQVRRSNAAGWAAGAVFLAFWMPYNNGLRPEPVVVLFSLLALCSVERAVATGRLMPAALGLVVAALSVGANPHGMVSVLPFVAALKPLLRLLRSRAKEFGWLPVLAPIAACGFIILTAVFSDQTWQSVMDATDLRTDLGPSEDWYQELNRYNLLFSPTPDGSLTRRFPVLLVILCSVTCAVVLLRRGRIRGAALGPSRRLLAIAGLSFVALALTPTKWSHHFGIFAAVGGALAALTALATSSTVLRSRRNRAGFFAGLMVICAFTATGPNASWYVSGWGAPWFDKQPSYHAYNLSTLFLVIGGIAAIVAFVEHLRLDENNPKLTGGDEQRSRALRLGTAPLAIVCALLVLAELATAAKVVQKQVSSYSLGMDNLRQLSGSSCGMSDYVYVETDPQAGLLTTSPQQPAKAAPGLEVPKQDQDEGTTPDQYLGPNMKGFNQPGLPAGDGSDPEEPDWRPPHQFGGKDAPVWGSYDEAGLGTGQLRSQWYDLPERAATGQVPVVLSIAGVEIGANSIAMEFGRDTPQGFEVMAREPVVQGPAPGWRDFRFSIAGSKAEGATKMRVVGVDQSVSPEGWLAASAPRAPQLSNMTDVVGNSPTFVEWTAALVHPCLQISAIHDGIAQMPRFRVTGGAEVRDIGAGWSSADKGGPFGWMNVTASVRELPTYMRGDLSRDWGSLYEVDPFQPDALPAETAMDVRTETHWGLWTPGELTKPVQLPGDVPSSDDRNDVKELGGGNAGGGAAGGEQPPQ